MTCILQHLDKYHRLGELFNRRPDGPPPAFRALQRQLHARDIDVTEAVLHKARLFIADHPEVTVGQFTDHLSSQCH